jgi:tetratricopeptide (TPR) repeat protein
LTTTGELARQSGQLPRAKLDWSESRLLLESLEREHPLVPYYRLQLANVLINIAAFIEKPANAAVAASTRLRAMTLLERLVTENPDVDEYRSSYATAQLNAGVELQQSGKFAEALPFYDKAIQIFGGLYPRFGDARDHFRLAYQNRGQAQSGLGRHLEGLRDFDKAIELDDRDRVEPRVFRAIILARLGDHAQAAAAADTLASRAPPTRGGLANLACVYAISAAACRKTKEPQGNDKTPEGSKLADRYADLAVDLLEKCRQAGLFSDPKIADALIADPDFAAIHNHPRFRALIEAIRARKKTDGGPKN